MDPADRGIGETQDTVQVRNPMCGQDEVAGRRECSRLLHDRHTHIGLLQSSRIIQPVADHEHRPAAARLTLADELQLL